MTSKKESKSFALPDVLRDLALLRVSQVRLDSLVPTFPISPSRNAELDSDLEKSYQFTKEARAAIRLRNAGKVEDEAECEFVRSTATVEYFSMNIMVV
ncbi:hypothetical protein LENED_000621 [Lentinula edodes]|uniref:Uncharacterized protein n=1 Tax=Lentinula edodes TaxID=5353 RepID=A0A1Q3DVZ9_LENED|nr:hypothetical protein LENED_000621 [Lentinula edodes]